MPEEFLDSDVLRQQLGGSMKLVETTCRLAGQLDLDQVLETITDDVCEALDCERASLFLYDEDREELYTQVVTELEIEEIRTPIENGITGWVARRRQVANIPDPFSDARWNSSIDKQTGFHTRNILAAPLVSQRDDRLVGVLQLLNKRDAEFDEFDAQLLQAFAVHASTALERAQLLDEARRSQELETDFKIARHIQASFLPAALPEIPSYEVASWWQPAESVSGDYYDLVQLQDGRLGIVVADVCGHGVGPSLIMASVRAMLHVLTRTLSDPSRILSLLSETIAPDLNDGRFLTLIMVALDANDHTITFANAGHGPALHYQRATDEFTHLDSTSPPLGFVFDHHIGAGPGFELAPGDLLILATDGAIELKNDDRRMLGRLGLEKLIHKYRELPAKELCEALRTEIGEFHTSDDFADDVTLMILERKLKT